MNYLNPFLLSGVITGGLIGLLGLTSCDRFKEHSKSIQEFPEPWQAIEPGKLADKFPLPRIIVPGSGPSIEMGDLVQIRVFDQSLKEKTWIGRGEWWIWIGFTTPKDTAFFNYEPGVARALVGMKQGSSFEFFQAREGIGSGPQYAGKLWINPLGDKEYYSWRTHSNKFVYLYVSDTSGHSKFEIQRVCKGKSQYRAVRLYDDGPVQIHGESRSRTSHEPREAWVDEARIEAKCNDGKMAIFHYGPIDSRNGKTCRAPVIGYFDHWLHDTWEKIPPGVQLK